MIAAARLAPLGDLHAAVTVSPRQLQRISRRFFEVPPAQVRTRSLASGLLDPVGHASTATFLHTTDD